jgi:uncharacterized membrane protein YtjA (UPF0391 family)
VLGWLLHIVAEWLVLLQGNASGTGDARMLFYCFVLLLIVSDMMQLPYPSAATKCWRCLDSCKVMNKAQAMPPCLFSAARWCS